MIKSLCFQKMTRSQRIVGAKPAASPPTKHRPPNQTSPATHMVANLRALEFKQSLLSGGTSGRVATSASSLPPASELTKRLKVRVSRPFAQSQQSLHVELESMDQDAVDVDSLQPVTRQLVSELLLNHRDQGVKALVACCLADLLRLFAPEAPFTDSELHVRDVF
jgi:hypothetical protein